ncbi:MAG: VWA domain-containing protein [Myxococcales bacterium]|nr:VWA domain-containing protein [Myxococcales bacterium]
MQPWFRCLLLGSALGTAAGCAVEPALESGRHAAMRESTASACSDGIDGDGDGQVDCLDSDCAAWSFCGGTTKADDIGCAYLRTPAIPASEPVDIVWAIDSSGSMLDEAEVVRSELARLATDLAGSSVDFRLVLMTASWFGAVPDSLADDPRYRFVPQQINQRDVLKWLSLRYPDYADFLRAGAKKIVVVVSDDDSAVSATSFASEYRRLLGSDFVFHAIASEDAGHGLLPGCSGPYGDAWDVGTQYYALADMTGGEAFSICTEDWSGLFDGLEASTVRSSVLPCAYVLPSPPAGRVFDAERINMIRHLRSGPAEHLPRAGTPNACSAGGAWYLEASSALDRVQLCPEACVTIQSPESTAVDIELGCVTTQTIL